MDQNSLIVAIITEPCEEYSPTKKRNLQCRDVDVQPVSMPRPSSQTVGYEGRKDAVEVEEEEEGSARD
jgi:hypothetical protein